MSYTANKYNDKVSYTNNADGTRSYGVKYIVESTMVNDHNIHAARLAAGMPARGAAYPYDPGVFVSNITLDDVKYSADKTIFVFNVEYGVQEGTTQKPGEDDPIKQPPKTSYGTVKYQVPFEKAYQPGDTQGNPTKLVVNAAGKKFDPSAVKMKINSLISIQYNVRIFRLEWLATYIDTINRSAVTILGVPVAAYCARINDLNAANAFDSNGREYWGVNISIEISNEVFIVYLLNNGYMAKNAAGTGVPDNIYIYSKGAATPEIKCKCDFADVENKIADGTLTPVGEPHLLAADGKLLAVGETPVYLPFQQNWDIDWSPLLIPKKKISSY
jgi:hypothetical protein